LEKATRLRSGTALKSDWVATVSHELKARESTERLLNLIEHLLSLARLEDGRERLDLRPDRRRGSADGVGASAPHGAGS